MRRIGVENRFGAAIILKSGNVKIITKGGAKQLNRVIAEARHIGGVNADKSGRAGGMEERHLPNHKAAPIMAGENRFLNIHRIQQMSQIAGQMCHVIERHTAFITGIIQRFAGHAETALLGHNHMQPGLNQYRHHFAPAIGQFGPAVAQHQRRYIGASFTGLKHRHTQIGKVKISRIVPINHLLSLPIVPSDNRLCGRAEYRSNKNRHPYRERHKHKRHRHP